MPNKTYKIKFWYLFKLKRHNFKYSGFVYYKHENDIIHIIKRGVYRAYKYVETPYEFKHNGEIIKMTGYDLDVLDVEPPLPKKYWKVKRRIE